MRDLTSEAKGYDINFRYRGKVFHINSSRLDKTREKLKQFGIEIYQNEEGRCIYLPDERKAVGGIKALPEALRENLKVVEGCTDFSRALQYMKLESFDSSGWDVSQGTSFYRMFHCCFYLYNLDLSSWDVSRGKDFCQMFYNCHYLESIDLSNWDLSSGEDFLQMFWSCENLKTVQAEGCNEFTIKKLKELVPEGCEVVY